MSVIAVSAQTTAADRPITSVGCVNRATQTGSQAPAPGVPPALPINAPALANSTDATGTYLLSAATPPDATDAVRAKAAAGQPVTVSPATYVLDGTRETFQPHAGHLVQVTGTFSTKSEGGTSNKTLVNHIQVASLKMLAPTCPNPKSPPE